MVPGDWLEFIQRIKVKQTAAAERPVTSSACAQVRPRMLQSFSGHDLMVSGSGLITIFAPLIGCGVQDIR